MTSVVLVVASVVLLALAPFTSDSAQAASYPSWADVQRAQGSEQAKRAEVSRIEALLASLTSRSDAAKRSATAAGTEYERAQNALTAAAYRSGQLDSSAKMAQRKAARSAQRAGQVAAALARSGSSSYQTQLIFSGGKDDLLSRLEMMDQLAKVSHAIYVTAKQDKNQLAAVAAQAHAVKASLAELASAAQKSFARARAAAARAQALLVEQQTNEAQLQAQLVVLQQNRQATEADYNRGVAARRAAAAAAAAARRAAASGGSGGSGSGWALPVGGWISDPFGPRPNAPVAGVNPFHDGTDIAAGCGVPVHAASGGTVIYAGWLGTYGNFVLIDHGGGVQTGYAHNSVIDVSVGQRVGAGEVISLVGTTGASTGCHLHFEVRVNGVGVDPVPFMRARGVTIG